MKSSLFNDVHNIGYTFFRDRRHAHESVTMPAKTADEHVKMRKQLRRMPRPYFMIALFVVQLFPS